MKFRANILQSGKTATGIEVPPEIIATLGSSKRPAVRVTLREYTYRTTVAVLGEAFMIPVSADIRKEAGVAAGDEVDVDIELDTQPREVTVPSDFADALNQDSDAKRIFDGLSYSNKQRFVLPIEEAKTAETRQRRIDKPVSTLRAGKI